MFYVKPIEVQIAFARKFLLLFIIQLPSTFNICTKQSQASTEIEYSLVVSILQQNKLYLVATVAFLKRMS